MSQGQLNSFKQFLKEYRETWNSCDASKMIRHSSKDLKVRWANSNSTNDWDFKGAEEGWKQAYKMYEGRNPKWYFNDILIEINNNNNEGVAIFWVRFEVDGSLTESKLLFIETFQKENNKWKKIREYVENSFTIVSTVV